MRLLSKLTSKIFERLKADLPPVSPTPSIDQPSQRLKHVLQSLSKQDLRNFVWLSTLEPNRPFNAYTLSIIQQVNRQEAQDSLKRLQNSRLLTPDSEQHYTLHESLRVFAQHLLTAPQNPQATLPRYGLQWIEAHQSILRNLQQHPDIWVNNHDIYFCRSLTWHLQQAKSADKIHDIICDLLPLKQWQQTIENTLFQEKVSLEAILQAGEADATQNFQNAPDLTLEQTVKYGLMRNTLKLIVQCIPSQWVRRLTETKHGSPEQALAYVLAQTDSRQKVETILTLKSCLLPRYSQTFLQILEEIKLDTARAQGIAGIFEFLSPGEKKVALGLIQEIKSNASQAFCISHIAPHLPVPLMHTTYDLITNISEEMEQAKALEGVVNRFTKPLQRKCLDLIHSYRDRNLKIRLFNQLHTSFPELKPIITNLSDQIPLDYSTLSIVWALRDKPQQSVEDLLSLLGRCPSDLDKVLLLSEQALEAPPEQLNQLWSRICSPKKWQDAIATQTSDENESLWASMVVGFMSRLSPEQIQNLIQEIESLNSSELRGELCLQLLPFVEDTEQYEHLYRTAESISDPEIRSKVLVQALGYHPEAESNILNSLNHITSPITKAEIQVHLLEHTPESTPSVLHALTPLRDETIKAHFLGQVLDLAPPQYLPNILDIIFDLSDRRIQSNLLQKIEPKLDIPTLKQLIHRLITRIYPTEILRNTAKQINRDVWESHSTTPSPGLSDKLLSQLPKREKITSNTTIETVSEVLRLPDTQHQSQVLNLYIQDIKWHQLDKSTLFSVIRILSQGHPLSFIQSFPVFVQGIASCTSTQNLAAYEDYCHQLSQNKRQSVISPIRPDTERTYYKSESQEFSPKTA